LVRLALFVASLINLAAGIAIGSLWYRFRNDDGMPVIVLFVGLALFIQGAYTLGYLGGLWRRRGIPSFQLLVLGESAAALVGGVAILQGVLYNLHPINGDYEFGPLLAATLMTTQAAIGLVYAARSGELPMGKNA
jgi:hypothetical protein